MPQFTPWNVPSPAPNVLFNPAAVDAAIADTQSKLGELDINRQKLGIEQRKLDLQQSGGQSLIDSLTKGDGTGTGTGTTGETYAPLGGPPDPNSPAGQVAQRTAAFWSGQGFTPEQVAGIMAGGPAAESSFNTGASGDSGTSYGLYQHREGRLEEMKKRYGPNPTEAQQHEFAAWEISPAGPLAAVGARLKQTKTPQEAAEIWTRGFESPANVDARAAQRAAAAGKYLGYGITPSPSQPTVGTNPDAPVQPPPVAVSPTAPPVAVPSPLPRPEAPIEPSIGAQVAGPGGPTSGRIAPSPPGTAATVAAIREGMVGAGADPATLAPGARMTPVPVAAPDQIEPETGLPMIPAPNQTYQPGAPGLQSRAAPLAPPQVVAQAAPPQPGATVSPGAATRPPVLPPPPAPSRTIPLEPVLPSGLTARQVRLAASMVQSGAPTADVATHVEQWKQANLSGRQQAATQAALEAQQNYDRQRQYQQDVRQRQMDADTAAQRDLENKRQAAADARAEVAAKNAGLPPGYRMDDKGTAYRIDGVPPDPAVAQAAKDDWDRKQREQPYQGTGTNEQNRNMLIAGTKSGEVGTPEYASAYSDLAAPRYNADGSFVKPNMAAYTKPTWKPPGATEVPDYASQETPVPTILTMEQGKAAGFADRIRQSLPVITDTSDAAMSRWQMLLGKAPIMGNTFVSPEFQLHQQSERNFINAVLRRESGAAINPDEFVQARQQYIPQPGDSPQVLAQKAGNRATVLASITREAGAGYKPAATSAPASGPIAAARDAISKGAPRDAVIKRLRDNGIDPGGL